MKKHLFAAGAFSDQSKHRRCPMSARDIITSRTHCQYPKPANFRRLGYVGVIVFAAAAIAVLDSTVLFAVKCNHIALGCLIASTVSFVFNLRASSSLFVSVIISLDPRWDTS
jgi:hypothetical protein